MWGAANADRQRVSIEQIADRRQRADRGDASGRHDGDMVGQFFQLFELMAGDEQAFAAVRPAP